MLRMYICIVFTLCSGSCRHYILFQYLHHFYFLSTHLTAQMDGVGVVLVSVSVLQGLGAAQLGAISVAVGVVISARREDVRSVSVLVDGSAGLVIAVALGGLHGALPVLVAPDNGVVRRDSVGESARVAVVVDIRAVDAQYASGGVGALLGNGLEAVGNALTVSGGSRLEVLLELGG